MNGFNTQIELRVDWSDLDLFGHVNNVAFFRYVQAARVHYCEKIGLSSLNEPGRPGFMVASSTCRFRRPLKFPDTIIVYTAVEWIKNTSLQFGYKIVNSAGEMVAEAEDVIVVFDHRLHQKILITSELRERIQAVENKIFSSDNS